MRPLVRSCLSSLALRLRGRPLRGDFWVGDSRLSRSSQRALPDCVGGGQPRVAKAGESAGITGSLERYVSESSLSNSDNSSMGVACVGSAPADVALLASVFSSPCPLAVCVAGDVNAHNSWQGPRRRKRVKGGVTGPAEDLRPVSEVEARVNFRPAAGCRFTSQEATRHRYQEGQGRCGHTFPPPGGSWYPIRVTWIRIGHQAIDGLDEGVRDRTVGDLGAKG